MPAKVGYRSLKETKWPYYTWGGETCLVYYMSEHFSIIENMRCMIERKAILDAKIPGVREVTMGECVYMVHFDPLRINGKDLVREVDEIRKSVSDMSRREFESTLIEIPIWFDDPWCMECYLGQKERHQVKDGSMSNFRYCAMINNLSPDDFKKKLCAVPYWVDVTAFILGIVGLIPLEPDVNNWPVMPKYDTSRIWTPERVFGGGGIEYCIYPYASAGGYQMLGISAVPTFSREKKLESFKDSDMLCQMGDVIVLRAIEEKEYNEIRAEVKEGTYKYRRTRQKLFVKDWVTDPEKFLKRIKEAL